VLDGVLAGERAPQRAQPVGLRGERTRRGSTSVATAEPRPRPTVAVAAREARPSERAGAAEDREDRGGQQQVAAEDRQDPAAASTQKAAIATTPAAAPSSARGAKVARGRAGRRRRRRRAPGSRRISPRPPRGGERAPRRVRSPARASARCRACRAASAVGRRSLRGPTAPTTVAPRRRGAIRRGSRAARRAPQPGEVDDREQPRLRAQQPPAIREAGPSTGAPARGRRVSTSSAPSTSATYGDVDVRGGRRSRAPGAGSGRSRAASAPAAGLNHSAPRR
jgi:hypothetical protein